MAIDRSKLSPEDSRVLQAAEHYVGLQRRLSFKVIRPAWFSIIGEGRLRDIFRDPELVLACEPHEKQQFIAWYESETIHGDPLERLAEAVIDITQSAAMQPALASYTGKYTSYRKSDVPGQLITGEIEIKLDGQHGHFFFTHTSQQKRSGDLLGEEVNFDHRGMVLLQSNRVYLLGVGVDVEGAYVRLMILGAADHPAKQAIVGVLTTETSSHKPFSCKTVLLHEAYRKELLEKLGEDKLRQRILDMLRNDSKTEDILYGGSGS